MVGWGATGYPVRYGLVQLRCVRSPYPDQLVGLGTAVVGLSWTFEVVRWLLGRGRSCLLVRGVEGLLVPAQAGIWLLQATMVPLTRTSRLAIRMVAFMPVPWSLRGDSGRTQRAQP